MSDEVNEEWAVYFRHPQDRRWFCLKNGLTRLEALELAANYEHPTQMLPHGTYPRPLATCERCHRYPGVTRHDYWLMRDDGMLDGVYWSEWFNSPRLLCTWCQHRQKAVRRWIRMRGFRVLGEE